MGLGVGIFLIAVGAILAFAVNATSGAVDIHTVGWILMGVGLAIASASVDCRRASSAPARSSG